MISECPYCDGTGQDLSQFGDKGFCTTCNGKGYIDDDRMRKEEQSARPHREGELPAETSSLSQEQK